MEKIIVRRDRYNIVVQKLNEFGLSRQVGLYILKEGADGKMYKAKIEWEEVNLTLNQEPTIIESVGMIEKSSLEIAIQNASEPVPVDSLAGKLEATEKHLEDMRKIAFEIPTETIREVTK